MKCQNIIKYILLIFILSSVNNLYSQYNDSIIIPYEEIKLMCTQPDIGNYIINNKTEYQDLLKERSQHPFCDSYELPDINFEKYTLIAHHSSVGGCEEPDFSCIIKKYDGKYYVKINITQFGICRILNHIKFWCLIPKEKFNSNIEFDVKRKQIFSDFFKGN